MRKIFFTFCIGGLAVLLVSSIDFQKKSTEGCPFCSENFLEAQAFYREEGVMGLLTYKPVSQGHVLIIPERHVERFEDLRREEIQKIGEMIQKIDGVFRRELGHKDYLLLQKNGKGVGQSVPHLHFHYVPARPFLAFHFFLAPWLKPLSAEEIQAEKDRFSGWF